MSATDYLWLPRERTEFEDGYVRKMNRIALGFACLNLPVFVAVAAFNGTGALLATVLTALVLVGPITAHMLFDNPRHVSVAHGITFMCLGGLLVHFGQGPLQIEMHFYFFILLAILAMFANPTVVIAAAATAAVHHAVIYLLLPDSVFNYEASLWVVAVHALFVVLESIAACYLARSFFDNVIGLDKKVQARTAELAVASAAIRRVLDNTDQGLFTIDRQARISSEPSAMTAVLLGELPASGQFAELLSAVDEDASLWFEVGWEAVFEGFMPLELTLGQLPSAVVAGDRHLEIDYRPIAAQEHADVPCDELEADQLEGVLVLVTDVTAKVAAAAAESEQRETMKVFHHFLSDKAGFLEFFTEAGRLVSEICDRRYGDDLALAKRWLHTLKGNSLIYGFDSFGTHVHELESAMEDENRGPEGSELRALGERWQSIHDSLTRLLGDQEHVAVQLTEEEYGAVHDAVAEGREQSEVLAIIDSWKLEPARVRLERAAKQAIAIADRMGKSNVKVEVQCHDVRLSRDHMTEFWGSLVHVIRNAVDHGLESGEERAAAGKPERARLTLVSRIVEDELMVEIRDDGRGIDWDKLAQVAVGRGLAAEGRDDLIAALFSDGITTKHEANEYSGRGVGMGAVRAATEALGGRVNVASVEGRGSCFQFAFPTSQVRGELRQAA